ncbi:MAG TPA: sigma-70 family RNA polymerase sigma factor [Acidobacteriota bacterium]|nr:sigma-70 family RNA polymerase sigma factor [Acidobacteriota bacterium]
MQKNFTWTQSNLQDRTLISKSRNGDHHAFESLVRKYRHQLLGLVCWHAGPAADKDDLLQLIVCKVYFSLKKFDLDRPFYPWLKKIAVNRCFDERRRLRRRKSIMFSELDLEDHLMGKDFLPGFTSNPREEENRNELGSMLRSVLQLLPKEYQDVIVLHHLQQLPYEEIAPLLKCSPQAARVKACRARAALRKLLIQSSRQPNSSFTSTERMKMLDACCRRNRPGKQNVPHLSGIRTDLVLCSS